MCVTIPYQKCFKEELRTLNGKITTHKLGDYSNILEKH